MGGGLSSRDGGLPYSIENSIVWGNTGYEQIYVAYGAGPEVSWSDVEQGWPGEGNVDADPRFIQPFGIQYVLGIPSPCIDAADPNEQDGINWSRVHPGYGRINSRDADMGAYGGPENLGWRDWIEP